MICTFFGHKDSPESVKPALELAVKQIVECYPDTTFYVGHNGSFDGMALSILKKLSEDFPSMSYAIILEYLPTGDLERVHINRDARLFGKFCRICRQKSLKYGRIQKAKAFADFFLKYVKIMLKNPHINFM